MEKCDLRLIPTLPRLCPGLFNGLRSPVLAAVAAPLVVTASCAAPDRSASELQALPEAATSYLEPDSLRGLRVADGAAYHYAWSPRGPWAVHLVTVDATRCDVRSVVAPATEGEARVRRRVSALTPAGPGAPFVGVNGDFFTEAALPLGPEISDATSVSASRPAFAWRPAGAPWIGLAEAQDGVARFGTYESTGQLGRPEDLQVVGGFPLLLEDGRVVGDLEVSERPAFASARHPRTGVGYDVDGERLWLVVVDGRQADHSAGMSLPEFAQLFGALGVEDALNLDGGGSSTMWVRGQVVNRPSDPSGERPVANSLWLTDLPGRCVPGAHR